MRIDKCAAIFGVKKPCENFRKVDFVYLYALMADFLNSKRRVVIVLRAARFRQHHLSG